MINKNNVGPAFIEMYKTYLHHGRGVMLCYISLGRKIEYVMFRQETGYKKFVLNEKLLELYNSFPD
jgi:hypothetical protein